MKSVAVIGTALMDTLLLSPSVVREETCNKVRYFEADGGSMRNVAHNCSLLGIPTVFWAKFGNDILALQMIQTLGRSRLYRPQYPCRCGNAAFYTNV